MLEQKVLLAQAAASKVVPVLVVDHVEDAVPMAQALIEGGITVLEVTLRTDVGLDVIRTIRDARLNCIIGAGTITSSDDVDRAKAAGAEFLVTPGTPQSLIPALQNYGGPVIPGISSVAEAMTLLAAGFTAQKFFPAEANGGVAYLKSIYGPLPEITFMPSGGVKPNNMNDYLSLPNVVTVGGTWLVTAEDLQTKNWAAITERAHAVHSNS